MLFRSFYQVHLQRLKCEVYLTLQPLKMDVIEGSETSAIINQRPDYGLLIRSNVLVGSERHQIIVIKVHRPPI